MTEFFTRSLTKSLFLSLLCVPLLACTGAVDDGAAKPPAPGGGMTGDGDMKPPAPSGSNGAPSGMKPPASSTPAGPSTPVGEPPHARLRKLTVAQFQNSLRDLLGAEVPLGTVEPDAATGFSTVGAASLTISPSGVGQYEGAVGAATTWLFADPARLKATLPCVPQAATDACVGQVITGIGRRAFRRSLTDAETKRYTALVTTIAGQAGSSVLVGLRHGLSGLLQSPNFLYRIELGTPSVADGGRLKYTNDEMASRLASALWNSVPDSELLDAAAKQSLATTEGVANQAKRMLADARAKRALHAFANDLYELRGLEEATPDLATYSAWTPTLREAMRHEIELRVEDAFSGTSGDYLGLLDSRTTFVNNELAKLYGLPTAATDGFRRVDLPADSPRAGLLGSGAILAGLALPQRTAPTRRGKFIREAILCDLVPPPPQDVPPLPPVSDATQTMRKRLAEHRKNPACAGCHALLDPLGFGLDNFDGIGRYRTTENGEPVDATGELDGARFSGLAEMGRVLRNAPVAGPCFVSKLYAYLLGRDLGTWDGVALEKLATGFASGGHRADRLLQDLVTSDAFRFVEPAQR